MLFWVVKNRNYYSNMGTGRSSTSSSLPIHSMTRMKFRQSRADLTQAAMSFWAARSRSSRLWAILSGSSGYPTMRSMRSKLMNCTDSLMIRFNVGVSSSLMKVVNLTLQLWASSYLLRFSNFWPSSSVTPLKVPSPSTRSRMFEKNSSAF